MKPQLIKVTTVPNQSFNIREDYTPHIGNKLHYHPEIEIIHIQQGSGSQQIGDDVRKFKSGDIAFLGPNLPHYWNYHTEEIKGSKPQATVIHFKEDFWGDEFLKLPENEKIQLLLDKAKRGIQITGKTKTLVAKLISACLQAEGPERIITLMEILFTIANSGDYLLLSSKDYRHEYKNAEIDRMSDIYEYTLTNFRRKIHLDEIAQIAHISTNSFCRYFKSRARKTYFQFLTELRVGYACRLLVDNKLNIKQICFESGFNNFASFHKHFKKQTGKSPLNYQKEVKNPGKTLA
jgi:AraC-like DNA-binding protein/quercetin dioxygenase-like cupin family protein